MAERRVMLPVWKCSSMRPVLSTMSHSASGSSAGGWYVERRQQRQAAGELARVQEARAGVLARSGHGHWMPDLADPLVGDAGVGRA